MKKTELASGWDFFGFFLYRARSKNPENPEKIPKISKSWGSGSGKTFIKYKRDLGFHDFLTIGTFSRFSGNPLDTEFFSRNFLLPDSGFFLVSGF